MRGFPGSYTMPDFPRTKGLLTTVEINERRIFWERRAQSIVTAVLRNLKKNGCN